MLSCIPGFLLFPVLSDRIGVFCAVLLPVIRVAAAPFPRTVPAHLAVLFVCIQFLLPVLNPPPLLTIHLTADRLLRLVLRGLKSLLTIAATPFSHTRGYRIREKAKNLESDVEYLPRPRRWQENLTTKPGKLRSFYTGANIHDINLRYLKNDHDLAVQDSVKRTRIGVSRRVLAMQPLQPHSIATSRKIDFERTIRRTKKPPARAGGFVQFANKVLIALP